MLVCMGRREEGHGSELQMSLKQHYEVSMTKAY